MYSIVASLREGRERVDLTAARFVPDDELANTGRERDIDTAVIHDRRLLVSPE
jgi:hypothetical protein